MALNGPFIVSRILAIQPGIEAVTLKALSSSGIDPTGVAWKAARKPANKDQLEVVQALVGQQHRVFELYRQTQSTMPKPGDKILDAASVTWTIQHIAAKVTDYVHECTCLKDL